MKEIKCKKCGSDNVNVVLNEKMKSRGCLASIMWIMLAVCTLGMIIFIPLLMKKGSKTVKHAVCQSCGYSWKM